MSRALIIRRTGPGVTVQDFGRPGHLARGLSRGGAVDPLALVEGAVLLGQDPALAAVEIPAVAFEAEATAPLRIALTGAEMAASRGDGAGLAWNAAHSLAAGERLRLTPQGRGSYGYLHLGGGVDLPPIVGGRGAHLAAGLGAPLAAGDRLPLGADAGLGRAPQRIFAETRCAGGKVRILAGPQTRLFPEAELARFLATRFERTAWGNRQGLQLGFDGAPFRVADGLQLVSETVVPGDVQITGDGTPYVLGPECQTVGGYPRIGTVLPQDLARVFQSPPGTALSFEMVEPAAARSDWQPVAALRAALQRRLRPLVRDPGDIPDLLSYQLIGGVTAGEPEAEGGPGG